MIKGRYVCQVEVDFAYEEDKEDKSRLKYGELYDRLMASDWMEMAFHVGAEEIFEYGNPEITVTRQYADIGRVAQP